MTTKKQQSRKNKSRFNKKQQKRQKKLFIGGTCSMCGSCMNQSTQSSMTQGVQPSLPPILFRGGRTCTWKRRRGGNDVPLNGLPQRYYYSQNPMNDDPNDPSKQIASRQLAAIKGGKSRTKKSKKGGELGFTFFNGESAMVTPMAFNPLNTIGDLATSQLGSNYISGEIASNVIPNPSVFSQPVNSKYNMYNMPLA